MTTKHISHLLDPNASETFIIQDYDPYVKVFCDSASKKIHAYFIDPKTGYKLSTQEEIGETLFFHTVYKKVAIWVRAERPSLDDEFIINFFATKKPIGTYSSEVPAMVRSKTANYHEGCKHYLLNCPNQRVQYIVEFPSSDTPLRERFIRNWLFYDGLGWQGTLGDPKKIYPITS